MKNKQTLILWKELYEDIECYFTNNKLLKNYIKWKCKIFSVFIFINFKNEYIEICVKKTFGKSLRQITNLFLYSKTVKNMTAIFFSFEEGGGGEGGWWDSTSVTIRGGWRGDQHFYIIPFILYSETFVTLATSNN